MSNETMQVTSSDVAVAEPEEIQTQGEPAEGEEQNAPEGEKKAEPSEEQKESAREKHNRRQWERLTRERAEFKAKAELYERQMQSQQQPANSQSNGRPARADYDNDEDYVDALTDWKVQEKMEPLQHRMAESVRKQAMDREWDTKMMTAGKAYPDFRETLESATDIRYSAKIMEAIKESDLGADLAYYLAKNPEDAIRIGNMTETGAIREIGRIESYLEYDKSQGKKRVSSAPPPARIPNASTTRSGSKSLADMPYDDYVKARNAMRKR